MKPSLKSIVYTTSVIGFSVGVLFGLQAKADPDAYVRSRTCAIAVNQANDFIQNIQAYEIDIKASEAIRTITLKAIEDKEINKETATAELKRSNERLNDELEVIKRYDIHTAVIMHMKEGCDRITSPANLEAQVNSLVVKQAPAIEALKKEIAANEKALKSLTVIK